MNLILSLLFLLIVYAPTFVANAVPVMVKNMPVFARWNRPVWEKQLGKNKTYRGLVTGVASGMICAVWVYVLMMVAPFGWEARYEGIFPSVWVALLGGFLQGFGALFGDMSESFLKRKLGKKPGSPWPFWDGVDYMIGSILFFSIIFVPNSPFDFLFLIFFAPTISLIANTLSYLMGWKDVRY